MWGRPLMQRKDFELIDIKEEDLNLYIYAIDLFQRGGPAMDDYNDILYTQSLVLTKIAEVTQSLARPLFHQEIKEIYDYVNGLFNQAPNKDGRKIHKKTLDELKILYLSQLADIYYFNNLPSQEELQALPFNRNAYIFIENNNPAETKLFNLKNGQLTELTIEKNLKENKLWNELHGLQSKKNEFDGKNAFGKMTKNSSKELLFPYILEIDTDFFKSAEGMVRSSKRADSNAANLKKKSKFLNKLTAKFVDERTKLQDLTTEIINFKLKTTYLQDFFNIASSYGDEKNKAELKLLVNKKIKEVSLPQMEADAVRLTRELFEFKKNVEPQIQLLEEKQKELKQQNAVIKDGHSSESVEDEKKDSVKELNKQIDEIKEEIDNLNLARTKIYRNLDKQKELIKQCSTEKYIDDIVEQFQKYIHNRDKLISIVKHNKKEISNIRFDTEKDECLIKTFNAHCLDYKLPNDMINLSILEMYPIVTVNKSSNKLNRSANQSPTRVRSLSQGKEPIDSQHNKTLIQTSWDKPYDAEEGSSESNEEKHYKNHSSPKVDKVNSDDKLIIKRKKASTNLSTSQYNTTNASTTHLPNSTSRPDAPAALSNSNPDMPTFSNPRERSSSDPALHKEQVKKPKSLPAKMPKVPRISGFVENNQENHLDEISFNRNRTTISTPNQASPSIFNKKDNKEIKIKAKTPTNVPKIGRLTHLDQDSAVTEPTTPRGESPSSSHRKQFEFINEKRKSANSNNDLPKVDEKSKEKSSSSEEEKKHSQKFNQ